jgi:glycerol kinase
MAAIDADTNITPAILRVDGGMARNNFVCQGIANQLRCVVERPISVETTAWGVAALAGLEVGIFKSLENITGIWQKNACFEPKITGLEDADYAKWQHCIRRIMA